MCICIVHVFSTLAKRIHVHIYTVPLVPFLLLYHLGYHLLLLQPGRNHLPVLLQQFHQIPTDWATVVIKECCGMSRVTYTTCTTNSVEGKVLSKEQIDSAVIVGRQHQNTCRLTMCTS